MTLNQSTLSCEEMSDHSQLAESATKTMTYYEANKEARKRFQKQYYEANKDRIKEYFSQDEIKARKAAYMREYRKKRAMIA
jgi:hypothetical protein